MSRRWIIGTFNAGRCGCDSDGIINPLLPRWLLVPRQRYNPDWSVSVAAVAAACRSNCPGRPRDQSSNWSWPEWQIVATASSLRGAHHPPHCLITVDGLDALIVVGGGENSQDIVAGLVGGDHAHGVVVVVD
jgi:hypothetical protein